MAIESDQFDDKAGSEANFRQLLDRLEAGDHIDTIDANWALQRFILNNSTEVIPAEEE